EEGPRRHLQVLPPAHRERGARLHDGRARAGAERFCAGARIDHAFLFRPGAWKAEGEYRDASGQVAPVTGETTVKHGEEVWRFEGVLRERGPRPALPHNRYEIQPVRAGARLTAWTSSHPLRRPFRGAFAPA